MRNIKRRSILITFILLGSVFGNILTTAQETSSTTIKIQGNTAELDIPQIACSSDNRIYIIWGYNYEINYAGSDVIYIQEIDNLGNALGEKTKVLDYHDISSASIGLGSQKIVIDSNNDLHIFWSLYNEETLGGPIFYKKLNSDFETLVDSKKIFAFSYSYSGREVINQVQLDLNNSIHLLCHKSQYLYLDDYGNLLDVYNIELENSGLADSLEVDSTGSVFISLTNQSDHIYLLKLESIDSHTSKVDLNLVIEDLLNNMWQSKLVLFKNNLYIYWFQYYNGITEKVCYKIDFSGVILSSELVALANMSNDIFTQTFNILSRNRTMVYSLSINQFGCDLRDSVFNYSLYTFMNDTIQESRKVLTIARNTRYTHGPSVCSMDGLEDFQGYFWFTWFINDGNNGFQVMCWKLDNSGIPMMNVTSIAPEFHIYTDSSEVDVYFSSILITILALTFFIIVNRRKKKL